MIQAEPKPTTTVTIAERWHNWKTPLTFALSVAILHRLLLMIWLPMTWLMFGRYLGVPIDYFNGNHPDAVPNIGGGIPLLENAIMNHIFGVWRRYDALHYMGTALYGYTEDVIRATVFPPGVSLLLRVFHGIIPGQIDIASAVLQTLLFTLVLTLTYRLCVDYYQSSTLGRWSVIVTALLPLSYIFAAPMSDSLYLFAALAFFLSAVHRRWWLAGVFAALATITRQQGAVLLFVAAAFVLVDWWHARKIPPLSEILRTGFRLAPMSLILVTYVLFNYYRETVRGFPPVFALYTQYWNGGLTSPWVGVIANYQFMIERPLSALRGAVPIGVVIYPLIFAQAMRDSLHRRFPLVVYTAVHSILFISLVYWEREIGASIGFGWSIPRYTLALFPLTIAYADWLRRRGRNMQIVIMSVMVLIIMIYSGLYVLFLGPA